MNQLCRFLRNALIMVNLSEINKDGEKQKNNQTIASSRRTLWKVSGNVASESVLKGGIMFWIDDGRSSCYIEVEGLGACY